MRIADQIRAVLQLSGVAAVRTDARRERSPGLSGENARDFEIAENLRGDAVVQKRFSSSERQFVNETGDETVTHIEFGKRAFGSQIEAVLRAVG